MKFYAFLFFAILHIFFSFSSSAEELSEIAVDFSSSKKTKNFIFGNNALGYDPCYSSKDSNCINDGRFSNWGAGQWDPDHHCANQKMLAFAKEIGIKFLRFPGGCGTHLYNWKNAIGPLEKRPMFQFGADEFLSICKELGAVPIVTLSYFTGTNSDLADFVEYLNNPLDSGNPNGGIDWALMRKKNGHPEPYGVRFFEFGNEVFHGNHSTQGGPSPKSYAERFIACRKLLKESDSNMLLGAVFRELSLHDGWNDDVVSRLKNDMDFGIVHIYPFSFNVNYNEITPEELFSAALENAWQVEYRLESFADELQSMIGKPLLLAVTEYNGGFIQEKPAPYRHSLGNALLVSDLLRIFLTTKATLLGANYWHFSNDYWGVLHQDEKTKQYVRRPNYFVFELFSKHCSEKLLKTTLTGPYCSISNEREGNGVTFQERIFHPSDWITNYAHQLLSFGSLVNINKTDDAIEIKFPFSENTDYYHTSITTEINPSRKYRLTGKMKASWPEGSAGIALAVQDQRGWNNRPWECAAQQITGTSDWNDVQVEFEPLPDAKAINIIIRRQAGGGPAHGTVWIKDVALKDIGPATHFPPMPFLSAVASTDDAGTKVNLIVINKNLKNPMPVRIKTNGFVRQETGKYWTLNGQDVASTNENGQENVKIDEGSFSTGANQDYFDFTFAAHSVTALEISKK